MSIQPSACPICEGRRWVGKTFRDMGSVTWKDLEKDPTLAYKPCPTCNADGAVPLNILVPVDMEAPLEFTTTNPAFAPKEETHE